MPRIAVPADKDPLTYLWTTKAKALTPSAAAFTAAVYEKSTLPVREFEAARITIAGINDCQLCLGYRAAKEMPERSDGADLDGAFYAAVLGDRSGLTEREALAAEFAERFALDHQTMDDAFFDRMRTGFTDDELADLVICCGMFLGMGRAMAVVGVPAPEERILV